MNIGNVSILDLRVGGMPVQSVYDGEHLVWTRESPAGDYWGLCFTAEEANSTVSMTAETGAPAVTLEYSTNANDWSPFTVGSTTVTLANVGDKVWMRAGSGGNTTMTQNEKVNKFNLTGKIAASGNVMSLLDGEQQLSTISSNLCFYRLFADLTALVSAPDLPATTLANSSYNAMFIRCTGLITPPAELPALIAPDACYRGMFENCSSLSTAPVISATSTSQWCFASMFKGCSNLVTPPPELPAKSLANYCYQNMFDGCTSLSVSPELPATTLASNCYDAMFVSCYSLTQAPQLPGNMINGCYASMFRSCINL